MYSKFTFNTDNNASVSVSVYCDSLYKYDIQCIADNNVAKATSVMFRNYCKVTFYIDFHGLFNHTLEIKGIYKKIIFNKCYGVQSCFIDKLDDNLTDCSNMFCNFSKVQFLHDVLPKNVKYISYMFHNSGLADDVSLDIPDSVLDCSGLFSSSKYVKNITLNFNIIPTGKNVFPDKSISIKSNSTFSINLLSGVNLNSIQVKLFKDTCYKPCFFPGFESIRLL